MVLTLCIDNKYGKDTKFYYEDSPGIEIQGGKYKVVGLLENGDSVHDAYCISPSQGKYEIEKYDPLASTPSTAQESKSVADKLVQLGQNPDKDVIETDNDNGRHHYLWNRPDLGEEVSSAWYSKNNWWIKIRKPTFTRQDLSPDMKFNRSNGVADSYIITSGPLKGGYYIESETQINIYSDAPRWHELNNY